MPLEYRNYYAGASDFFGSLHTQQSWLLVPRRQRGSDWNLEYV